MTISRLEYRPEIDGLRAISVIGVLCFHGRLGLPGGFVGVDVFFVISGFLISSLILKELDNGRFTLRSFWERRVRRIVPALVPVVIAVLTAGYWLLLPADLVDLGKSAIAQSAMAANMFFWRDTGYTAGPAELKPLLHTWSLAIEEQFYFFLPLVLLSLHRFGRRTLTGVLLAASVLSFAGSIYGSYRHPSATFYLLPTRAWELLAGCLLATSIKSQTRSRAANEVLAWIGIGGILAAMLLYDRNTVFPGLAAALPVGGAMFIIMANSTQQTSVGRLLSLKPVVFIGMISYSLYLWHWPLLAYARYVADGRLTSAGAVILCLASFVLAALSFYYCEQPVRRNRLYWSVKRLTAGALTGFVLVVSTAASFWYSQGCVWRVPANLKSQESAEAGTNQVLVSVETSRVLDGSQQEPRPSFIVWGDSHAGVATPFFARIASQYGITGLNATSGGSPPLPGVEIAMTPNLPEWNARILEEIGRRGVRHVFLIARWASYVEGATDYDILNGGVFNQPLIYKDAASATKRNPTSALDLFDCKLTELCARLVTMGCRVYILPQVPEQDCNPPRRAFTSVRTFGCSSFPKKGSSKDKYLARQSRVMACFHRVKNERVQLLDYDDLLFDSAGATILSLNDVLTYRDNQHLSEFGVEHIQGPSIRRIVSGWSSSVAQRHGPARPDYFYDSSNARKQTQRDPANANPQMIRWETSRLRETGGIRMAFFAARKGDQ